MGSIFCADPLPLNWQPDVIGLDRVPRDSKFRDGDLPHPRPNIGNTGWQLEAGDVAQQFPLLGTVPAVYIEAGVDALL